MQVACYGSNVMINLIDDKGKEKEICQSLSYIAGKDLPLEVHHEILNRTSKNTFKS